MSILILFGVILIISIAGLILGDIKDNYPVMIFAILIMVIAGAIFFVDMAIWFECVGETKRVNWLYKTNYTVNEMFWIGDTIKEYHGEDVKDDEGEL